MSGVPVSDGARLLEAKGLRREYVGAPGFDLWLSLEGQPEMVPFLDSPANQMYDGDELDAVLSKY